VGPRQRFVPSFLLLIDRSGSRSTHHVSSARWATLAASSLLAGMQLKILPGATQQKYRHTATFTYNEDFIVGLDEATHSALVWDARTGELVQRLSGHNNVIRWVASSPVESALLTCRFVVATYPRLSMLVLSRSPLTSANPSIHITAVMITELDTGSTRDRNPSVSISISISISFSHTVIGLPNAILSRHLNVQIIVDRLSSIRGTIYSHLKATPLPHSPARFPG